MPKIYLSKEDYERDHGKGALERKAKVAGSVRTAPYSIDRNRVNPNARTTGIGGRGQQQGRNQPPPPQQQQQLSRSGSGGSQRRAGQQQQQQHQEEEQWGSRFNMDDTGSVRSGVSASSKKSNSSHRSTSTAVSTAKVLVASGSHPRKEDIRQLLHAFERGWVPDKKFQEELQKLIF